MIDLTLYAKEKPVSLADISKRQEISLSYLEQLFAKLRQNGLVKSVRGPGGGYRLSRSAELINTAEVIDAVNETIDATSCAGKGNCNHGEECLTHKLWADLSDQIHNFLSGISLADVTANKQLVGCSDKNSGNSSDKENDEDSNNDSFINTQLLTQSS